MQVHSHGRSYGAKREIGDASHAVLTVGSVVALVAFPGMSLAPGGFVRGDILRFGKIGGALVERSAVATRILRSRSSLQMRRYSDKWNCVFDNPVRAGLVSSRQEWKYAGEIETLTL